MNAETVVSVLFNSDSNSDWNGSNEEGEDLFEDNSWKLGWACKPLAVALLP